MNQIDVALIGAGIAGLAAAQTLLAAGRQVVLFDKGAKPGGRLATRRTPAGIFNHGCQFLTLRDPAFTAAMQAAGAQPWVAAGSACYAGVPDMAALAEATAQGLDVRLRAQATSLTRADDIWHLTFAGGAQVQANTLLLAIPAPQAVALLPNLAPQLAAVRMAPCWTVMLATTEEGPNVLRPENSPLGWIAREASRPAGQGAGYTIQATAAWSEAHLEDPPETIIAPLTAAFTTLTGITAWQDARAHRWRYALATHPLGAPFIWDETQRLGLCGDWCLAGRLEAAFLSGQALGISLTHEP